MRRVDRRPRRELEYAPSNPPATHSPEPRSPIAQLVERRTVNPQVPGSSPGRGAIIPHRPRRRGFSSTPPQGPAGATFSQILDKAYREFPDREWEKPPIDPYTTANDNGIRQLSATAGLGV